MPTIVNTYTSPNASLGKSLEDLGNSIWGPQEAAAEYAKQKAHGALRENQAHETLQNAERRGGFNPNNGEDRAAVVGLENPRAFGQGQLVIQSGRYGATSPQAANAAVGSGEAYSSTAQGTREGYANQRDINDMTTQRQMAVKKYELDNTPTPVYENGRIVMRPRSQVMGAEAPPTKESVTGAYLRGALPPPGAAPQADAQPAAPAPDPFANLPPRMQHFLGVQLPDQQMVHPATGAVGTSRDGGQTVQLLDGRTVPAVGFTQVPQEAALNQARDNNVRQSASQPLVAGNPAEGQAAADARQASGLGAGAQRFLNTDIGSVPGGPAVLKAVTGSPEIAPETQRAQSRIDLRNQQARAAIMGNPGRPTVYSQKMVDQILPQGATFANPETEAQHVSAVVSQLMEDYTTAQRIATDPNTSPADRVIYHRQMQQLAPIIHSFTDPAPQAATTPAAPATPPAAPQQQAQPQGVDPTPHIQTGPDGVQFVDTNVGRLFLRNGQWSKQ